MMAQDCTEIPKNILRSYSVKNLYEYYTIIKQSFAALC